MLQPKRSRELQQLVQANKFGEDIGNLPFRWNINQFDFIRENKLADEVVMHLNVLGPGVENGILRELDAAEAVAVDRRRI